MLTVLNKRRGKLRLAGGVELLSGPNQVDAAKWKECCKNDVTQHYLKRKEIFVVPGSDMVRPEPATCGQVAERCSPAESGTYQTPESPPLPLPETSVAGEKQKPSLPATDVFGVPDGLMNMKARDVIDIVKASSDARMLRQMLTIEMRGSILRAIEKRLAELRG